MPRKEKKCETCAYAQGFIKTLIDPCPRCVGKTSIFPVDPIVQDTERGRFPSGKKKRDPGKLLSCFEKVGQK